MLLNPFRLFSSFRSAQHGNVAAIFAITLVPLIAAMGCAIDYTRAAHIRSKLQAAIDSASVGAITRTSQAFVAAGAMKKDGPIAVGNTDARNIFDGNMASRSGYTLNSFSADVRKLSNKVLSTVEFSADVPTTFTSIIGWQRLRVTGTSNSRATMPVYIDFHLLLDNSPSMGVGATTDDVDKMVKNTSDKCAFACHDTSDNNNYYKLAKKLGVTTRIDRVREATQQLMIAAKKNSIYAEQYRMAIYDFGASAKTAGLRTLFSLSPNLDLAKDEASKIDLMTVNGQNENNDQDTQYSTVLPALEKLITDPGAGTTAAPQKFVFFVSDGVADEYNSAKCKKPTTNGRCQSPIDPNLCEKFKSRGITVGVLYTTYLALPTNDWYNQWIKPFNAGPYGPSPNSEIAANMKACASSPDLYSEVSMSGDITQALMNIFDKAVADARISS